MKTVIYVLVQSVITDNKNLKNIIGTYTLKHEAENGFNDIVIEFENKQDDEGNFLWECESPWWNIANFKSNTHNMSFRLEIVEREIEI